MPDTFTLTSNPGGRFTIVGNTLRTAVPMQAQAGTHRITVRRSNPSGFVDRDFNVTIASGGGLALTPVTNQNLAMGMTGIVDWTVQLPFLDVMKSARSWTGNLPGQFGGWGHEQLAAAGALDANGWLTAIPPQITSASLLILTDLPVGTGGVAGRYVLTWQGAGALNITGRVSNVVIGANTASFDFTPGPGLVGINITAVTNGNPIRNMTCVREDRAALLAGGQVFNPDWLARIRGAKTIRFMDWQRTNDNPTITVADRPRPSDYTYTRLGAPIEVMVALANELNAHPWINIPHQANDAFCTLYANTLRDGLEPGLIAHVEYSNEVWNFQFSQATWANDRGRDRWNAESTWVQFYALRSMQVMDLFTASFGAQASTRLCRIIATQTGFLGLEQQILAAPRVIADGLGSPHLKFDAYAITGYFSGLLGNDEKGALVRQWITASQTAAENAATGLGLTGQARTDYIAANRYNQAVTTAIGEIRNGAVTGQLGDSVQEWVGTTLPYHVQVAANYNLRLMMYEGGTHAVGFGANTNDAALTAFFNHLNYTPEMAGLYQEVMIAWAAATAEPFNAFVDLTTPSQFGSWGHLRHLTDNNPRWQMIAAPLPPIVAPANTVAPSISGTATVGQTLTGANGTWTGNPTFARQWLRNGTAISGATGATYVLVAGDQGANIAFRVTGTNGGGAVVATSAAVGPVAAAPAIPAAMAADAGKLFWYSPSNVTVDGSNNLTAWPDNSGNGHHLNVRPTPAVFPVWAGTYAQFNGNAGLRTTGAGPLTAEYQAGREIFLFIVAKTGREDQATGTFRGETLFVQNEGQNSNQIWDIGVASNAFTANEDILGVTSNRFNNAHQITLTNQPAFIRAMIVRATFGRTRARVRINNGVEAVQASDLNPANVPDAGHPSGIGGVWSNSGVNSPLFGRIYEIYATTNASPANLTAIYDELAAKYAAIL